MAAGKGKIGPKQELILSGALLLLAAVGWYLGLYAPIETKTAKLNQDIRNLEDSVKAIEKYKAQEAALQVHIARLTNETTEWDSRFPPRESIVSLTKVIISFTEAHNLQLIEVLPSLFELYALERAGAQVSGKFVMQLPINFKLQGRYLDVGKMLGEVDTLPFNVTIQDVDVTALPAKYPNVEARISMFLYVHL
ncbi:MAG: type 4a pilus biogenesis protein PilO [Calditrichota bacterium]